MKPTKKMYAKFHANLAEKYDLPAGLVGYIRSSKLTREQLIQVNMEKKAAAELQMEGLQRHLGEAIVSVKKRAEQISLLADMTEQQYESIVQEPILV